MLFKPPQGDSTPALEILDRVSGMRKLGRVVELSDSFGQSNEITKFGSITLLNNSAVFENGQLLTIVPKGLSINDLNIVSSEKDAGFFQSSLTIDALYLNCKDISEDEILQRVFWINPVFENAEGTTQSINYTISFTKRSPDNSSVYLIIALMVFTFGLAFIIILTLSKFGQIKSLDRKLKRLTLEQKNSQKRKQDKPMQEDDTDSVLEKNETNLKATLIRMTSCETSEKKQPLTKSAKKDKG